MYFRTLLVTHIHTAGCFFLGDLLNPDLGVSLDNLTFLLEYMFQNCVLVVQKAVRDFSNDLTIKTDGRKFLYIIAKLSQLQYVTFLILIIMVTAKEK